MNTWSAPKCKEIYVGMEITSYDLLTILDGGTVFNIPGCGISTDPFPGMINETII